MTPQETALRRRVPRGGSVQPTVPVAVYINHWHVRKTQALKVTKTKTGALKQEPYNPIDLKHDPHCGFVELEASVLVS